MSLSSYVRQFHGKAFSCLLALTCFTSATVFAHGEHSLERENSLEHENSHELDKSHQHHKKHGHMTDSQSPVVLNDGYARATFPMAKTAAAYFTLHNHGENDLQLSGVTVDAKVADEAQIHTTKMEGDVMRMRHLIDGVTIGVHEHVTFTSGGYHVMFLGLKNGLSEGEEVQLTLHFDGQEPLHTVLPVKADNEGMHKHGH
jgi:copper(I)-binding protein